MKHLLCIFALSLFALSASAEEKAEPSDPFDLTESTKQVSELGVVTQKEVDALQTKATELYTAEDCQAALPVLKEFVRKSNWLANMVHATLDPYYGASYDDRKEYSYEKISKLIPYENLANGYKRKRNIAMAMQADCHTKLGNTKEAIPLLLKTLDLLELDNDIWWDKTRENLMQITGVKLP